MAVRQAIFRPSCADKWANCPFYAYKLYQAAKEPHSRLQTDLNPAAGKAAEIGTAKHEAVAQWLISRGRDSGRLSFFTPAERRCIQLAFERYIAPHITANQFYVELSLPRVKTPQRRAVSRYVDLGGTMDFIGFAGGELLLLDWKFGKVSVSPVMNEQLSCYLELAAESIPAGRTMSSVKLVIVQPNAGNGEERIKESGLYWPAERYKHAIRAAKKAYKAGEPPAACEGAHCAFCPLKNAGICPLSIFAGLAEMTA